jgi:hypothetical protein
MKEDATNDMYDELERKALFDLPDDEDNDARPDLIGTLRR